MEINCLSREMAKKWVPQKPELMIGLLDTIPPFDTPIILTKSDLRLDYLTYTFDDIDEIYGNYVKISPEIATQIVKDFARYKNKIESLVIHCAAGMSRSPAVAAALNDSFDLEYDEKYFFGQFMPNRLVYREIRNAGNRFFERF